MGKGVLKRLHRQGADNGKTHSGHLQCQAKTRTRVLTPSSPTLKPTGKATCAGPTSPSEATCLPAPEQRAAVLDGPSQWAPHWVMVLSPQWTWHSDTTASLRPIGRGWGKVWPTGLANWAMDWPQDGGLACGRWGTGAAEVKLSHISHEPRVTP